MNFPNLGIQETNTDAPQPGINNFLPKPQLPGINNFMSSNGGGNALGGGGAPTQNALGMGAAMGAAQGQTPPPRPISSGQAAAMGGFTGAPTPKPAPTGPPAPQPGGFFGNYGQSKDVTPPPYVPPPPVNVPGLGGGSISPPPPPVPGNPVRSLRGPGAVGAPPPAPFWATPAHPDNPTGMQYNDSKYNHPAPPPPVAGPPGGYGALGNGAPQTLPYSGDGNTLATGGGNELGGQNAAALGNSALMSKGGNVAPQAPQNAVTSTANSWAPKPTPPPGGMGAAMAGLAGATPPRPISSGQAAAMGGFTGAPTPPRPVSSGQAAAMGGFTGAPTPPKPMQPMGGMAGSLMSDERSKAKIEPLGPKDRVNLDPALLKQHPGRGAVALGSEQMGHYAGVKEGDDMGLIPAQSAYYKQPIHPGVDLRAAQGFSYDYKNPKAPGAAPGRQVGPMAQDLEGTAAAAAVHTDPKTNMKSVDTGRLALVNTAALAEEQKRTDRLESMIAAMRAAPKPPGALPPPLPRPSFAPMDTSALDDAYARQSQVNPRY